MNLQSCGWCCGIFSFFAIIFLVVVAQVINNGSPVIKLDEGTSRSNAVQSLQIAAAVYLGFFILSIICIVRPQAKHYLPPDLQLDIQNAS